MDEHPLGQWLSYRETLPITWRLAAGEAVGAALAEQNLRMLAAAATLEERGRIEPDAAHAQELDRLNHKFDVMIELLGALLRSVQPPPPGRSVQLSREGLSWTPAEAPPAVGSAVVVDLYLHPCAPGVWRWSGEVVAHCDGEICVRFSAMPEALAAALERHVFMRHRRSVAEARSPAGRGQAEMPQ